MNSLFRITPSTNLDELALNTCIPIEDQEGLQHVGVISTDEAGDKIVAFRFPLIEDAIKIIYLADFQSTKRRAVAMTRTPGIRFLYSPEIKLYGKISPLL